MEEKKLQIRNGIVDILVFTKDTGKDDIEVRVQAQTVWLTQTAMGQTFDVDHHICPPIV